MQTVNENLIPERFTVDNSLSACKPVEREDEALAWRVGDEEARAYSSDRFPCDKQFADGTVHRVFRFVCKHCRSDEVSRLQHTELTSAFAARCQSCGVETLIHFAGEHGYAAHASSDNVEEPLPDSLDEVACKECSSNSHRLVIEMLYMPESLDEALEIVPSMQIGEAYEGLHIYSKCLDCGSIVRWVSEACS